jgi:hypothetical protein
VKKCEFWTFSRITYSSVLQGGIDISRKCIKTSNGNKHKNGTVTRENPMFPVNLSPTDDRLNIRIPKKAKLHKYFTVDNQEDERPYWQQADALLLAAQYNKELFMMKLFDVFVESVGVFYPEKKEALNMLRPLIFRQILKGDKLDDNYFKDLKGL